MIDVTHAEITVALVYISRARARSTRSEFEFHLYRRGKKKKTRRRPHALIKCVPAAQTTTEDWKSWRAWIPGIPSYLDASYYPGSLKAFTASFADR